MNRSDGPPPTPDEELHARGLRSLAGILAASALVVLVCGLAAWLG